MTNTKFRKRALLSSVAMLLVAMLALGSATFAWFTVSKTTNAQGLILKTTTSAGIVCRSQTCENASKPFAKTTILNYDSTADATNPLGVTLSPASFLGTATSHVPNFASTTSDDPDISIHGATNTISAVPVTSDSTTGSTTNILFAEKVYLKSTSGNISGVTADVTWTTNASADADIAAATYCAVVDDADNILFVKNSAGTAPAKHLIASSGTFTAGTSDSTAAYTTTSGALSGNVDATGSRYVWVVLFLDGEDANVYTTNVQVNTLFDAINVTFTMP